MLVGASKKGYLNEIYFAVMDERTKEDGSSLLCYSEDGKDVDNLRAWPKHSSLYFRGMQAGSGTWDDIKELWENQKERTGKDVIE